MDVVLSKLNNSWVKSAGAAAFLSFLVYKGAKKAYNYYVQSAISKKCKEIREERDKDLENFYNIYKSYLTPEKIDKLTSLSATEIINKIKLEEISCFETTLAFILRTVTVGLKNNAIADLNSLFLENCLLQAKKVDKTISETKNKNSLPPLLGLPISIKDQMKIRGLAASIGGLLYPYLKNKKEGCEDAEIVALLKNFGAIPICLSNVPQGLLSAESTNELWGFTHNAWKKGRTAGGSSGGEASLVASRCSPIGIGSDIGGSIRIPSSFNGLYGFKPSNLRYSKKGVLRSNNEPFTGWNRIINSIGPIARNVDDLVLINQILFGHFDYRNPNLDYREFNYNEYQSNNSLNIAVVPNADFIENSLGVENVMKEVITVVKKKHNIMQMPFNLVNDLKHGYIQTIFQSSIIPLLRVALNGQKLHSIYDNVVRAQSMSTSLKKILAYFYNLTGEGRLALQIKDAILYDNDGVNNIVYYNYEKAKGAAMDWCIKNKIDAFLSPVTATPAFAEGEGKNYLPAISTTMYCNALDFAAGTVPIRLCKEGEDTYDDKFKDSLTKSFARISKGSDGLPICVQVASYTGKDELVLRLMKELEEAFNFHQLPA